MPSLKRQRRKTQPFAHASGSDSLASIVLAYFILILLAISFPDAITHSMQLESLKIFCDVIRHRSFSHAAQLHDVTQSAVSQIVSQLEKRMKVKLIDRSTRPLRLTALGLTYYEGCKALLE